MKNTKNFVFKAALLSPSLLLAGVGAVSAILPNLQEVYSSYSKATVQQFISVPILAQMFACLAGGFLAGKFGKKRMMMLGCLFFVIGGITPMFTANLILKIALRFLLGIGVGLLQPLSASMIADYFNGPERDNLMGVQSSLVGFGNVIMTFIVGLLIGIDWKISYLVYFGGLIICVFMALCIPETAKTSNPPIEKKETMAKRNKLVMPKNSLAMGIFQILFNISFNVIVLNLGYAVVDSGLGDARVVAFMLTAHAVASMLFGLIYGRVYGILKNWTGTVALLLVGLGFLGIGFTSSLPVYFICVILAGIGFSWFMAYTISSATEHVTEENSSVGTALVFAGGGLGGFLAPYIILMLGNLFGNTGSVYTFVICGVLQLGLGAVIWIYAKLKME